MSASTEAQVDIIGLCFVFSPVAKKKQEQEEEQERREKAEKAEKGLEPSTQTEPFAFRPEISHPAFLLSLCTLTLSDVGKTENTWHHHMTLTDRMQRGCVSI